MEVDDPAFAAAPPAPFRSQSLWERVSLGMAGGLGAGVVYAIPFVLVPLLTSGGLPEKFGGLTPLEAVFGQTAGLVVASATGCALAPWMRSTWAAVAWSPVISLSAGLPLAGWYAWQGRLERANVISGSFALLVGGAVIVVAAYRGATGGADAPDAPATAAADGARPSGEPR